MYNLLSSTLMVFIGGGLGAVVRFGFIAACRQIFGMSFPWGVLGVNVIGSFAMGLVAAFLTQRGHEHWVHTLLGVGFLGGFTTFSAFSLDVLRLIERDAFVLAGIYVVLSVALSVAALVAGFVILKTMN